MKTEKFKVIDFIRMFIKAVSVNLENFPKKELELKTRVKSNSYDMLEIAYEANSTEFIELKINLINKMLAKIKLVDYLLDMAVEFELLSTKQYIKLSNRLSDIEKFSRGWMSKSKEDLNHLKLLTDKNVNILSKENEIPENNLNKNKPKKSEKARKETTNEKMYKELRTKEEKEYVLLSEDSKIKLEQLSLWAE